MYSFSLMNNDTSMNTDVNPPRIVYARCGLFTWKLSAIGRILNVPIFRFSRSKEKRYQGSKEE